jgi:MFS family permease
VGVFFFASIVATIDRGILNLVVDGVRHDLSISDVQIGLLQGLSFGLFYAAVGLPLGLTADRFSRKWLIVVGISVWSLATLASGFATSFGWLFACRLLVGAGEAALSPAAISMISDLFTPTQRGKPIGVFMMGQSLANGLSILLIALILRGVHAGAFANTPILGGLAGWRVSFLLAGCLGFVVVAMMLLLVREPARGGMAGRALKLSEALGDMRRRFGLFATIYGGFAGAAMAYYSMGAWGPTFLSRKFGVPMADVGRDLGPVIIVAGVSGALLGGIVIDVIGKRGRTGGKLLFLAGVALCAIGSAMAVFAPTFGTAILLVALFNFLFPVVGTGVVSVLQDLSHPNMRGLMVSLSGLTNTLIAATAGPLLVAYATEHVFGRPVLVGYSLALVLTPALVLGALLFIMAQSVLKRATSC